MKALEAIKTLLEDQGLMQHFFIQI